MTPDRLIAMYLGAIRAERLEVLAAEALASGCGLIVKEDDPWDAWVDPNVPAGTIYVFNKNRGHAEDE